MEPGHSAPVVPLDCLKGGLSEQPKEHTEMKLYYVTLNAITDGGVAFRKIGTYKTIAGALRAAKRAAKTDTDCTKYGPQAVAFTGSTGTAVVSW